MMYSIRNVEDGQTVALIGGSGDGESTKDGGSLEFCVGLTLDESIVCSLRRETRTPNSTVIGDGSSSSSVSSGPGADNSQQQQPMVVPLMMVTVWKNSGVTICPASRDLPCRMNGEELDKESNVIPGSQIEVADKTLMLVEGPIPERPRPHRRHLPPTPGVPILSSPPPKPQRLANNQDGGTGGKAPPPPLPPRQATSPQQDSLKEELKEWCGGQLPNSEHDLLKQVRNPDELASIAFNYLSRHANTHTDISMTKEVTDRISNMLQEIAYHRKEILRKFLSDVISDTATPTIPGQTTTTTAASPTSSPSTSSMNSPTQGVQHSTVTSLLVEILRQFLDPQSLVLTCLQLLRALSHAPGSVRPMVGGQTISAVLGSMAVFRDDEEVQGLCLDILAKMATYVPNVLDKPPMRESSIELVLLAMSLHDTSLTVMAACIRVLANLAASLHALAFHAMIGSPNPAVRVYTCGVLEVLDYLYQTGCQRVRGALADCGQDLNIKMDGRRFLFEYAKMDQLRCQHLLWESQPDSPIRQIPDEDSQLHQRRHNEDSNDSRGGGGGRRGSDGDSDVDDYGGGGGVRYPADSSRDTNGILKKSRSFENLRTPDRKVFFKHDHDEDEDELNASTSSNSSSSSSSSTNPNANNVDTNNQTSRSDSPDIQVLSRSRICPTTLSPVPSYNGENTTTNNNNQPYSQQQQQPPPRPFNSDTITVTTPPTPNAPPIRRQIQAPLVHINSQSDSEAETPGNLDSPPSKSKPSEKNINTTDSQPLSEMFDNPDDRYADICDLDPYSDTSSSGLISDYSSCSSPFQPAIKQHTPHPHLPGKHITHKQHTSYTLPANLEGFSYTSADVVYMKRVMSVQITCHVCSASIKGSNSVALKLIDLPLRDLLQQPGIPKAVAQFAASQFDPKATLMDIDPAMVIAIIDAVRYKMLAHELVRKSLHALIQRMSPRSVHQKITLVVGELLQSVATDSTLSPIVEDSEFVGQLQIELERLGASGLDPSMTSHLLECLQSVATLTSKEEMRKD